MIKNHHYQSINKSQTNNLSTSILNNSQNYQIEPLMLNSNKKSSSIIKSSSKQQSQRIMKNNDHKELSQSININQFIKNLQENNTGQCPQHRTDREILLQKRKSYAQSIRQKNKQHLQQQKSKAKKSTPNESMNISYAFTPPKDSKQLQKQPFSQTNINQQYYSLKKQSQSISNNKVFKESNTNKQNQNFSYQASQLNNKLHKSGVSAKVSSIMNSSAIDAVNYRDINQQLSSRKSSINNKQNKFVLPQPNSTKKTSTSKCTSYAQIFDKKVTMHALINHQKSKGNLINNSSASRQLNSVRKDKSSLKSMATADNNYDFRNHQFSTNLDCMQYNINGFVVDQLVERIEDISRIDYQFNQSKQLDNFQVQQVQEVQKNNIQVGQVIKPTGNKNIPKLSLQSQTVYEMIDLTQQYERIRKQQDKQIMILAKQNSTFKRQLATFRKQNTTIRKQLQNCKNYIKQLQQKAKAMIQQQKLWTQNQSKLLNKQIQSNHTHNQSSNSNYSYTHNQPSNSNNSYNYAKNNVNRSHRINQIDNNLEQILECSQKELFGLKSNNKALELKVYMLQKKLVHEQELNKKRLALEVNSWKQKYNKLRNQHLRVKNSIQNPFLNSDWSISMDISRDQ